MKRLNINVKQDNSSDTRTTQFLQDSLSTQTYIIVQIILSVQFNFNAEPQNWIGSIQILTGVDILLAMFVLLIFTAHWRRFEDEQKSTPTKRDTIRNTCRGRWPVQSQRLFLRDFINFRDIVFISMEVYTLCVFVSVCMCVCVYPCVGILWNSTPLERLFIKFILFIHEVCGRYFIDLRCILGYNQTKLFTLIWLYYKIQCKSMWIILMKLCLRKNSCCNCLQVFSSVIYVIS